MTQTQVEIAEQDAKVRVAMEHALAFAIMRGHVAINRYDVSEVYARELAQQTFEQFVE